MRRLPPRSTRTDTLCPYTTLFRSGYEVPIYGRPANLVDVDLGQFTDTLKGKRVRGRVEGENLVPYYDRTAIEQGVLSGDAPVIAWGADPVEVFFLQIQGSGNLRLPDGGVLRLGYDDQNGRRSEERLVGKEWVSTCRSRWAPSH